jgi:2,3-bisphosphoglycerate-dependent phosphoglycerate mutase
MNKEKKISYLVLVRHGQSEWNEKNLFTGWKNPPLTEKGIEEAEIAGEKIKNLKINFSHYFTSALIRAQETGEIILRILEEENLTEVKNQNLNERDYGDLSGLNKDEARKEWGENQVHIWRRSFDIPPPGGESLKDTSERVLPYFDSEILPFIKNGKSVLICAHGNSLRSLIMSLENISPEEIVKLEIGTGDPILYSFSEGNFLRENL